VGTFVLWDRLRKRSHKNKPKSIDKRDSTTKALTDRVET
jgi:hypothetical protein